MKRVSRRAAVLLALAGLPALMAGPASAGWFAVDRDTGLRKHIGSAPNPTPADIRAYRAERVNDQVNSSDSGTRTPRVVTEKTG